VESFDGTNRRAQRIIVAVLLVLAIGLGTLVSVVPDEDSAGAARLWVGISLAAVLVAGSRVFSRMRLELHIDEAGFTVRVWPFRRVRVDAQAVVDAELVEVRPFWEFGGWWHKGLRSNRFLGGTGSTALRVTYLHQAGAREPKTCRLTLLTSHAEHLLDVLQRRPRDRA
jgi:hypothetical protein